MPKQPPAKDYGIGENSDGTVNAFSPEEFKRYVEQFRAIERGAEEPDDLSDLGEIEDLFGSKKKTDAADWNEADHPRGQPENAGEFASTGGGGSSKAAEKTGKSGGYSAGVKASGLAKAVAKKEEWRKAAPDSVEKITAAAPVNQAKLAEVADAIGKKLGVAFKNPGPKKPERIAEKIARGKTPQQVSDAVRGGYDVASPEQSDELVKALAEHFEVADEGWQRTPNGYFDRKVMIRFEDGMIGEIQMWPPGMLDAKSKKGHKLYEEWQKAPPGPQKEYLVEAQIAVFMAVCAGLAQAWKAVVSC